MKEREPVGIGAGAVCIALVLVLSTCTPQVPDEGASTTNAPIATVTWAQVGHNLYDAHVAVSTFCLYGGVYAQTPNPENGFHGYINADSLGLQHAQGNQLVIYDVVEGEDHWIKVGFGVGGDERFDFFINPYHRVAGCGADALKRFHQTFRATGGPLSVAAYAQVFSRGAQRWFPRGQSQDDVAAHSDEVICALATGRTYGNWDSVSWSLAYIEEATRRGFTPASCAALIGDPVLERNARLDQLNEEVRRQLAAYWPNNSATGLSKDDYLRTLRVGHAFQAYTKRLKRLPAAVENDAILEEMSALFRRFEEINAEADHRLLSTDERELLVPLTIAAAELCGLDASAYPDGDPTRQFRSF